MSSGTSTIRVDIQLLRAAAVLSVLLFHFWPTRLPGGFVGVDVFFVISGFLITSLIVREVERSGRLNLVNFWMRRIRRIFPASIVVIAATAITVNIIGSPDLLTNIGRHVFASAFSWENILLAMDQTDYFRSVEAPSPLQHFWSLAVEEQFYVVWPLVVVIATAISLRFSQTVRLLTGVIITIVVASAAYALFLTFTGEPTAYYNSLARAWELGLGALVAIVAARGPARIPVRIATSMNRVAWVLLLGTFLIPGLEAGVPSWGVAPAVILTAIVISTGNRAPESSTNPIATAVRGVGHWVGDRSFSLYLWHWPILILAPYVLGTDLVAWQKVVAIAIAFGLSELSYRFVETPVRNSRVSFMRNPFLVVPVAGLVSIALALGTVHSVTTADKTVALDTSTTVETMSGPQTIDRTILGDIDVTGITPFCSGAGAAVFNCPPSAPSDGSTEVKDDPRIAAGCPNEGKEYGTTCFLGDTSASTDVLFIGDSHARALAVPMDAVGKKLGWRIHTYAHSACPFSLNIDEGCRNRNDRVLDDIRAGMYDIIVTAQSAEMMPFNATALGLDDPALMYSTLWRKATAAGVPLVTFADNPILTDETLRCVRRNFRQLDRCEMTRQNAWRFQDFGLDAAAKVGAHVIDLRSIYCDGRQCPQTIGTVRVMQDKDHITPQFAATLAPFIWAKMWTFNLP